MREWNQHSRRFVVLGACCIASVGVVAAVVLAREPDEPRPAAARLTPTAAATADTELSCDDVVDDGPRIERFDRRWDVIVDPLAFVGLRQAADEPRQAFRRRGGTDAVWKAPLALKAGAAADIEVLTPTARDVSTTYLRPSHQITQIGDGARSLRVTACDGTDHELTAWPGGFLMRRPQCVRLRITVEERAPRLVDVGFGVPECPRPT